MNRCPGNLTNRLLDSVMLTCSCGRKNELFSDEQRRKCRCGKFMYQKTVPKCADWCPSAELCLGIVGKKQ